VVQLPLGGYLGLALTHLLTGALDAAPLVTTSGNAGMGLHVNVLRESGVDLLKDLHVMLAVLDHVLEGLAVVLQHHLLPQVQSGLHLTLATKEGGDVIHLVAVKVEVTSSPLQRINGLVAEVGLDPVEDAAGLEPRKIESVAIVGHHLISGGSDNRKPLEHEPVALLMVPVQVIDLILVLPLVADADNGPLMDNRVGVNELLWPCPPKESDVRGGLNIPKQTPDFLEGFFHTAIFGSEPTIASLGKKKYRFP